MLCALFYGVLCIFSIVTGIIYMSGRKELNPLELSDRFVEKLSDQERKQRFARQMGFVTFVVGIIQGITSYSIYTHTGYGIALGFTIFSIASVLFKLKGKINAFPLLKLGAYVLILVILLVERSVF